MQSETGFHAERQSAAAAVHARSINAGASA